MKPKLAYQFQKWQNKSHCFVSYLFCDVIYHGDNEKKLIFQRLKKQKNILMNCQAMKIRFLIFICPKKFFFIKRYKNTLQHKIMTRFSFFVDRTFFLLFSFARICYLRLSKADDVLSGLYFVLKPKNVCRIGS